MAYTDPADVRLALSPGGDETDVESAASLEDADLVAKIADATDEVNAKLSSAYPVPFADPVPDLIRTITVAIAAYLATLTYRRGEAMVSGDPVQLAYLRAEQMLTQLQSGGAVIPGFGPTDGDDGEFEIAAGWDGCSVPIF